MCPAVRIFLHPTPSLATDPKFSWLNPPGNGSALTVRDVLTARSEIRHSDAVETWARSVWSSWELHHETVAGWVDDALGAAVDGVPPRVSARRG